MCHKIFYLNFLWFEPIWVPDKQAKVFLNSVLISPHHGDHLRGVQYTVESRAPNFEKCTLQRQTAHCEPKYKSFCIDIFCFRERFPSLPWDFILYQNDPAAHQDHCWRCRIRTRDLCPRMLTKPDVLALRCSTAHRIVEFFSSAIQM